MMKHNPFVPEDFKFRIEELVCPHLLSRYGEWGCWMRIDSKLILVLHWLRESLGLPIVINTYHNGDDDDQSGARCNLCQLVRNQTKKNLAYASAHVLWKAADLSVTGMTAQEVRDWIAANIDSCPCNIRLEGDVSWVHIDVIDTKKPIHVFYVN
jgi:hypothetical protein